MTHISYAITLPTDGLSLWCCNGSGCPTQTANNGSSTHSHSKSGQRTTHATGTPRLRSTSFVRFSKSSSFMSSSTGRVTSLFGVFLVFFWCYILLFLMFRGPVFVKMFRCVFPRHVYVEVLCICILICSIYRSRSSRRVFVC